MKNLPRYLLLSLVAFGLVAARAQSTKTGYRVLVEVTYNEQGAAEVAKVVQSDDPSAMHVLDQIAAVMAGQIKQEPRLKDGKPVGFKIRAPFEFPVEGDEGPAANNQPKPAMKNGGQPVYPESLAASGTVGGAILELSIGADGAIKTVTVMRASHPEFGQSAQAAIQNWAFAPAKKDGVPVESRWRIAVNFAMEGKETDWKWRVAPRPSLGEFTVARVKLPAETAPVAPAEKK